MWHPGCFFGIGTLRFINSQLPHWSFYECLDHISNPRKSNWTTTEVFEGPIWCNLVNVWQWDGMSAGWCLIVCLCLVKCLEIVLEFTIGFYEILVTCNVEGIYVHLVFQLRRIGESKVYCGCLCWFFQTFTPLKTNISPENWWLEDEFSFRFPPNFQGQTVSLREGIFWRKNHGKLPKEATRCFTAVATLEGEDKGNAREAAKIGWWAWPVGWQLVVLGFVRWFYSGYLSLLKIKSHSVGFRFRTYFSKDTWMKLDV